MIDWLLVVFAGERMESGIFAGRTWVFTRIYMLTLSNKRVTYPGGRGAAEADLTEIEAGVTSNSLKPS